MTDKQINSWLRRRFSMTGWVLIGYYVLMNLLCVIAMAWEAGNQLLMNLRSGSFPFDFNPDALMDNGWGYVAAIGVLFFVLHGWKGPEFWKKEVFRKEKSMKSGVFAAVLCLCMGSQMVNSLWLSALEGIYQVFGKSLMPMLEAVSGSSDTLSMFLYASVLAPIAEEVLFRGYILRTLEPYGRRFAIFGSAFLFGLFHGNLLQTPYAFLMGLVLGYVAMEYSVIWAMAVHFFNNFVLADLLTRLTENLPEPVYSAISLALFGGAAVASGILLFAKRREIAAHIQSEWMDRRVLKCFFTCAGVVTLTALMLLNALSFLP